MPDQTYKGISVKVTRVQKPGKNPEWVRKDASFSKRPESEPYYSKPMVIDITGLSRHTIDRLVRVKEMPAPIKENPPILNYSKALWLAEEIDAWWKTCPLNRSFEREPRRGERIVKLTPQQKLVIGTAARCIFGPDHDLNKFLVDIALHQSLRICELTLNDLDDNDHYEREILRPRLEKIFQEGISTGSIATGRRRDDSTSHQPLRSKHQPMAKGLDDVPSQGRAPQPTDGYELQGQQSCDLGTVDGPSLLHPSAVDWSWASKAAPVASKKGNQGLRDPDARQGFF